PVYRFTGPGNIQHRLGNHNHLLTMYSGAIGMKTGYTRRAGSCLIAAARRNGRTMLTVVLHAPDMYGFSSALLDKGFSTPVEAEPLTDALPPVPADAAALAQKLKTTPTTESAPAPGGAGESAAALLPHGRHSDPLTSGPALVLGDPLLGELAAGDLVEDRLHLFFDGLVDDPGAAGEVAVLSGVGDREAHAGDAVLVHEVDDQLQLVEALEVGRLGLVAGLD